MKRLFQGPVLAYVASRLVLVILVMLAVIGLNAAQQRSSMAARSPVWRCEAEKKWSCELPTGCEGQDPKRVWILLEFAVARYQRCDRAGCDSYPMNVSERGIFTYIRLPDHPDVVFKAGLADMFTEVRHKGCRCSSRLAFASCRDEHDDPQSLDITSW